MRYFEGCSTIKPGCIMKHYVLKTEVGDIFEISDAPLDGVLVIGRITKKRYDEFVKIHGGTVAV